MSWLDDLMGAASTGGRIVADLASEGIRSLDEYAKARAEARADEARWDDIDDRLEKAALEAWKKIESDEHEPEDPKGLVYDPFDMVSAMGYRERPSAFTYQAMDMVGRGVPVVADVIKVRTTQVQMFCQRPEDRHSPGMRCRLRDWQNQEMTEAAQKEAALLEEIILNTGYAHKDRPHESRKTLKQFAGLAIPDSLIFDQVNFEIVRDRKGEPSYLRLLDPSTIRLLDPGEYNGDDQPFAVQVIDGSTVADFTREELAFCTRQGRTGLKSYGYGLSELETLVREITGFLWGMDYNRKFFCASGNELVQTDSGLMTIPTLLAKNGDARFRIWNGFTWREARAYKTGDKPAVRTQLWNGLELTTSQKHRFRTVDPDTGHATWTRQEALEPGTTYVLTDTSVSNPEMDPEILRVGEVYPSDRVNSRHFRVTEALVDDPEFWELLGFALGDGFWPSGEPGCGHMGIYPHYEKDNFLFDRFLAVCERHGINAKLSQINQHMTRADGEAGYPAIHVHHVTFLRWLTDLGFRASSDGKRIPEVLYQCPAWVRAAVMRGLWSADGHRHAHRTGYATPTLHVTDRRLRKDVLTCMWSLGVAVNETGTGWDRKGEIRAQDIDAFVDKIGYLQPYKNEDIRRSKRSKDRWDCLAPETGIMVADLVAEHPDWLKLSINDRAFASKVRSGVSRLSRPRACRWLTELDVEIPEVLRYHHVLVDVIDEEPTSIIPMFDIEVFDDHHAFLANHIAVHNTQGSAQKGILNFKGSVPDKHLKAFRRQWYAMLSGVSNAWKTPITNAEELQWINLQLSNRDMEYSAWMDFLIKIICARYQIAPEEVNFAYGNTGQSQAMGTAPIEEKLKASHDLGLRPLVWWFFEQLNLHLVQKINPDFEVVPVGLDQQGFDAETDLLTKQQHVFLTVDEARERVELEPIGEERGGHLILDPTYAIYLQQKEAQELQQQQMEEAQQQAAQAGGGAAQQGAVQLGPPGQQPSASGQQPDPGDFGVGLAQAQGAGLDKSEVPALDSEGSPRHVRYIAPLQ